MVQRYSPIRPSGHGVGIESNDEGSIVLYSDYEVLKEDRDAYRDAHVEVVLELTKVEARVKELEVAAKANEEDLKRLRQYERRI